MSALLKAVVLGILLTLIVTFFIGSGGSSGGMLNVRGVTIQEVDFYWSWSLFLMGTGISFGILLMME